MTRMMFGRDGSWGSAARVRLVETRVRIPVKSSGFMGSLGTEDRLQEPATDLSHSGRRCQSPMISVAESSATWQEERYPDRLMTHPPRGLRHESQILVGATGSFNPPATGSQRPGELPGRGWPGRCHARWPDL